MSSPLNRVVQLSMLWAGTKIKILKPKSSYRMSAPSACNPCAMKAGVMPAGDRGSKGADTIAREGSLCHVYHMLQNQFNIIHGLVNHCSEALQDKWIFSVAMR